MTALYSHIQNPLLEPGLLAHLLLPVFLPIVLSQASLSAPVPALTTASLNEVIDPFVTSKVTDLKEPIRMDLSRSLFEPQDIRSADTDRDRPQGEIKIIMFNYNFMLPMYSKPRAKVCVPTDDSWH